MNTLTTLAPHSDFHLVVNVGASAWLWLAGALVVGLIAAAFVRRDPPAQQ